MAFFFKQNLNNPFENFALALFSTHKFKKKKLKSVQFFFWKFTLNCGVHQSSFLFKWIILASCTFHMLREIIMICYKCTYYLLEFWEFIFDTHQTSHIFWILECGKLRVTHTCRLIHQCPCVKFNFRKMLKVYLIAMCNVHTIQSNPIQKKWY